MNIDYNKKCKIALDWKLKVKLEESKNYLESNDIEDLVEINISENDSGINIFHVDYHDLFSQISYKIKKEILEDKTEGIISLIGNVNFIED